MATWEMRGFQAALTARQRALALNQPGAIFELEKMSPDSEKWVNGKGWAAGGKFGVTCLFPLRGRIVFCDLNDSVFGISVSPGPVEHV